MATISLNVLGGGFDTDSFWAVRWTTPTQETATTYDFLNVAGYFVRFSGTGFAYNGHDPSAGSYTSIGVYTDPFYTTLVDSFVSGAGIDLATFFTDFTTSALGGDDTIIGSTGNDKITGYGGADTLDGRDGDDTYFFSAGDVVAGEAITDSGNPADTDTLVIRHIGGNSLNFSAATVSGIEALTFEGSGFLVFDGGQLPADLAVTGVATLAQNIVITGATNFDASGWVFAAWGDIFDSITIVDSGGNDTIVGSSQRDTIASFSGADALDGWHGSDWYQVLGGTVSAGFTITDTGTGVGDIDTIELFSDSDFSAVTTITGIEAVVLLNVTKAIFRASHLPGNLALIGDEAFGQAFAVVGASSFSAAAWTFTDWGPDHTLSISGTAGNDTIVGSSAADLISGGAGSDSLDGGAGGDQYAFASGDVGAGEAIHDTGTSGLDTVLVDVSVDFSAASVISGIELFKFSNSGNATFRAAQLAANTALEAVGVASHTLTINEATVFSAAGWTFTNWGPTSSVVINGSAAGDTLTGSSKLDRINGGAGSDTIEGGLGDDILDGGADIDVVSYASSSVGVTVSLALTGLQDTQGAGLDRLAAFEQLVGSAAGADSLTGDDADNVLSGLGGNDVLTGGGGADTLQGGLGADTMRGGTGNDSYAVDNAGDVVDETGGSGRDTVVASRSFNLSDKAHVKGAVENLVLLAGASNGTGNSAANVITGNARANVLTGNAGNDTLDSAGGNDKLRGGAGNDKLLGGAGKDSLFGDSGKDTLSGGAGNDVLVGGAGRDLLTGGAGADRFDFDTISHIGKTAGKRDVIKDFSTGGGDLIDLRTIDANGSVPGNGKFIFLAAKGTAFTGVKGELHWFQQAGKTIVEGDVNGDKKADFQIELTGLKALTAGDFVL